MLVEAERRHDAAHDTTSGGGHTIAARLQLAIGAGYRLLGEMDGGGMSRLFLAEQLSPCRLVAVKVLTEELGGDGAQLLHEAALTGRLRHPHILPILAAGEGEGLAFLVTPWVSGGTLRDRLRSGAPLSAAEARRILREIAVALAHVHAHGVVHGDLKPDNVLLRDGHVLLADFGAALRARPRYPRRVGEAAPLLAVGTPLYMSPEQAAGDPYLCPRSDVYSFGVLAFELLTGHPPFAGPTPRAVLLAHLGEPAPCLLRLRPDLPLDLVTVIARALAKDPAERQADGTALVAALDRNHRFLPLRGYSLFGARAGEPAPAGATSLVPASWRARAASMAGTLAATAAGVGLSALGLAAAATMMLRTVPPTDDASAAASPIAVPASMHDGAPIAGAIAALPPSGALGVPGFPSAISAHPAHPSDAAASGCAHARKTRTDGKTA
ncbi:MAG TPA: serine/threonine-protein kinase [Gemmatimonadales bacterium]